MTQKLNFRTNRRTSCGNQMVLVNMARGQRPLPHFYAEAIKEPTKPGVGDQRRNRSKRCLLLYGLKKSEKT